MQTCVKTASLTGSSIIMSGDRRLAWEYRSRMSSPSWRLPTCRTIVAVIETRSWRLEAFLSYMSHGNLEGMQAVRQSQLSSKVAINNAFQKGLKVTSQTKWTCC